MLDVTKEEIEVDDSFLGRLNSICSFNNLKAQVICGCVRHIGHTNIAYLEPHRIIIGEKLYLYFNGSDELYINDLSNKIRLCELDDYIKSM